MNFAELAKAQAAGFFLLSKMAGKLDLATQVQGVLPVANGGTGSATGALNHSGLANLAADSHSQYALLAGRTGGQTLVGGTASSENLNLQSTSHATKGRVNFGGGQVFFSEPDNGFYFLGGNLARFYSPSGANHAYINVTDTYAEFLQFTGNFYVHSAGFGWAADARGNQSTIISNQGELSRSLTISTDNHKDLFLGAQSGVMIVMGEWGGSEIRVGLGTTTVTEMLSLHGGWHRKIWMERNPIANTAGYTLTVEASGAAPAATDKAGGQLILKGGISTGSASSGVTLQGYVGGSSGTSDNSPQDMIKVLGNKLGFFAATPVVKPAVLTSPLTTLTFAVPATPDYAIATVQLAGYGFSTADEGNTVLSVIANLQDRVNGLETKLQALGLLT